MRKGFDSTVKICVLVVFAISLFFVASCRKSSPQTPPSRQTEGRAEKPAADVNKAPATPTNPEPAPPTPTETTPEPATTSGRDANTAAPAGWVPIEIKLPKPMFVGTPQDTRVANLEKPMGRARPPFLAPTGVKNVAAGKPVTSSDEEPIIGEIEMITDGDKEAADGSYVELGPLLQHVTIDLEAVQEIYAILVWHYHKQARVYYDVVVQVADDADFITNVKTVFNNDIDNSAGLGVGSNMHYTETNEGKLIDAKGVRARYVRLYSNGNTGNDLNHYIEVEVYGKPVQ